MAVDVIWALGGTIASACTFVAGCYYASRRTAGKPSQDELSPQKAIAVAKEALQVEDIQVHVNLFVNETSEGRPSVTAKAHFVLSGNEVTTLAVHQWLDARGLVMQPKACDFKVRLPATGAGKA